MDIFSFFATAAAQPFGTNTVKETASQSESGVAELFTQLAGKIPGIIAGMIVIIIAFAVAGLAKRLVLNKVSAHISNEDNESIMVLIGRATYVMVLSVGLAIGLKFWGIDVDALLAAFGFGIAFAMRDIMINFIAGILILVAHHFGIGDFIEIGGSIRGKVEDIQGRATVLKGLDGTKIIVPNKDIFNKEVVSYTTNPFRRIEIVLGVDYNTTLDNAQKIIMSVLKAHPAIIKEPEPQVLLDEFADSSINMNVRFWVESKSAWVDTKSEIVAHIKNALDKHHVTIPFPIRTIAYDKDGPAAAGDPFVEDAAQPTEVAPVVPTPAAPELAPATANNAPAEEAPTPSDADAPDAPAQDTPQPKSEDTGAEFLKK